MVLNDFSKYFNLQSGLSEGALISCTLCNIFISDLVESLNATDGIKCLSFPDA